MTNGWPHQSSAAMNAFYGNPDPNHDGIPDRAWEDANLVSITPPYAMFLAWAPTQRVKTIRVHKSAADSLLRVLRAIFAHYGSQAAIEAARMHLYGGCYNFRLMRGGTSLSIHSWGGAIDIDPEGNPFGGKVTMPAPVVSAFAAENWTWGGPWSKHDGMHFQAANL